MGTHESETLIRVRCGGEGMTTETRKLEVRLHLLEELVLSLKSRLTDLEDRVTENGG